MFDFQPPSMSAVICSSTGASLRGRAGVRAGYRRIGSEHASWKGIAIEYSHPSHFVGRISRSSRLQIGRGETGLTGCTGSKNPSILDSTTESSFVHIRGQ